MDRGQSEAKRYIGDGRDILLQGFHWPAHAGVNGHNGSQKKTWYRIIQENAAAIKAAGFTWVWFPPPSDSLSPQGYIPRRWNILDTAFGSEAELRTAITAINPVRALADIVVNHRVGVATAGPDFADPPFRDNRAAVWPEEACSNWDAKELCIPGRPLNHGNPDVRATVKHYLNRLKDLGFRGWRYDMAKGLPAHYVGEYIADSAPEFAVGEFFDGDRQKVTNWIDKTGGRCAAFDFPTRFLLFQGCTTDDYSCLRSVSAGRVLPAGLLGYWPSHAVTFVDNHDTEYRREEEHRRCNNGIHHFPGKTVAMSCAYILTHPGVPCVYWSHFFDWDDYTRQRIERLIQIRKSMGIHARSQVTIYEAKRGLYAASIDGRTALKLGTASWSPGSGWQLVLDGDKFAVWTRSHS
jgi:alpha-amylase